MKVKGVERVELLPTHLYILNNMKEVQSYLAEHKRLLKEHKRLVMFITSHLLVGSRSMRENKRMCLTR